MLRKRTTLLLLLYIASSLSSLQAQKADALLQKLPPGITLSKIKEISTVYIVSSTPLFIISKKVRYGSNYIYTAEAKKINIDSLLRLPSVLFIQPIRKPVEELSINGSDLSLNKIFYAHSKFPFVTGKRLTVSIKESLPDTSDIDFKNRFIATGLEASVSSSHATIMATLIGGAGNTYYRGKGAAYKTNLTSFSYDLLLPEHDSVYRHFNISAQNHSYGTGIENFYGADSYAYDLSINNNDSLLHVFSAGNSGTLTSSAGKYQAIAGFANITGSFKQSKNSLSIGATDSLNNVELLSSKGPAYDGRIKPELVAFGQDGSSGAAAIVTGSAILVQDIYKQKFGLLPSSSLVRAALINASDDILQPGPDYTSGFGSLNTERAIKEIANDQFYNGTVSNGGNVQHSISVPANAKELKITLCWNDIAAMPNAPKALINDLDIELIEISTGIIHYPLVLSSFPHIDSLNATASERRDTLNTVEQIVLNNPTAGNYVIVIKGSSVQNSQYFSVVYNWEMMDDFRFTFPTKNDNLFPENSNTIRWQSFANSALGNLDISYDAGTTWESLSNNVPLSNGYYKTAVKDTVTVARLRMSFGTTTILSDSFTIMPRLKTTVGFNCADSFSIYWNKLANVNSYTVYTLADSFMMPQYQTTDTFIIIHPNVTRYFAVEPNLTYKTGSRSIAFDYTTQGVGCFLNNFLADLTADSTVNLTAILGAGYYVKQITFQRLYPTKNLATFVVNRDTFTISDKIYKEGIYYYRAKLLLNNGAEVISDTAQVTVFKQKNFFVYPNPFRNGNKLVVQLTNYNKRVFELFNSLGQKMYQQTLQSNLEYISLPWLQRGIYFYRIVEDDKRIGTGKLIVE